MSAQSDSPLLHKREQTAERLQCSVRKVEYLVEDGELEAVHSGRSMRILVASEDKYVEKLRQREIARRAAKAENKAKAAGKTDPAATKSISAP
jgi:excisionase family DNA binding protein